MIIYVNTIKNLTGMYILVYVLSKVVKAPKSHTSPDIWYKLIVNVM